MHNNIINTLRIFWYKRKTIVLICSSVVVLTVFFSVLMLTARPKYTAETTVTMMPSKSEIELTNSRDDFLGMQPSLVLTQTHTEFLLSRKITAEVVEELLAALDTTNLQDLIKDKSFIGKYISGPAIRSLRIIYSLLNYGKYVERSERDNLIAKMQNSISIRNVAGSYILNIGVTWDHPVVAQKAANLIAQKYIDLSRKENQRSLSMTKSYISAKIDEYKEKLNKVERNIKDFKEKSKLYSLPRDIDMQFEELNYYINRRTELVMSMVTLQSKIAALKNIQSTRDSTALIADYRGTQAALKNVNGIINNLKEKMSKVPNFEYEIADLLQLKIDYQQTIAGLQKDLIESTIQESGILSAIHIIDEAQVPLYPSSPKVLFNLIGSFIASLVFTLLYIVLTETISRKVYAPQDVSRVVPLTGIIASTPLRFLPFIKNLVISPETVRKHYRHVSSQLFDNHENQFFLIETITTPLHHIYAIFQLAEEIPDQTLLLNLDPNYHKAVLEHFTNMPNSGAFADKETFSPVNLKDQVSYSYFEKKTDGIIEPSELEQLKHLLEIIKQNKVYKTVFIIAEPLWKNSYALTIAEAVDAILACIEVKKVPVSDLEKYAELARKRTLKPHAILTNVDFSLDFQFR